MISGLEETVFWEREGLAVINLDGRSAQPPLMLSSHIIASLRVVLDDPQDEEGERATT